MVQQLKGKAISNKMNKTVVVEVLRLKKHPRYGKYIKISDNYKAHTEDVITVGSSVLIELTRPISKDKRWKVVSVAKQAVAVEEVATSEALEDSTSSQ